MERRKPLEPLLREVCSYALLQPLNPQWNLTIIIMSTVTVSTIPNYYFIVTLILMLTPEEIEKIERIESEIRKLAN